MQLDYDNEDARLNRAYDTLTDLQKAIIDKIAEFDNLDFTTSDVIEDDKFKRANVYYVRDRFPHLIAHAVGADIPEEYWDRIPMELLPEDEQSDEESRRYHFGPDAQLDRDWGSLTPKQKNVIRTKLDYIGKRVNKEFIAEQSGCEPSYVDYVEKNFPHILNNRMGAMVLTTDGGGMYTFQLPDDVIFDLVSNAQGELAQTIWEQVRTGASTFTLNDSETLRAIQMFSEEMSKKLWDQVRGQ